jgi:hypothetical protein
MRPLSEILTDVMADPTITDDVREAIQDGLERPHRHCPCAGCMRAYLRSVKAAPVKPAELAEGAVL